MQSGNLSSPLTADNFKENPMYNYSEQKAHVFTDDGQKQFLRIRDKVHSMLEVAGAVSMTKAISGETGVVWDMMACVDRLVEIGEIVELTKGNVAGQYRIFVDAKIYGGRSGK